MAFIPDIESTFIPDTESTFVEEKPFLSSLSGQSVEGLRKIVEFPKKAITYPAEAITDVSVKGPQLDEFAKRRLDEMADQPSEYPVFKGSALGALATALELVPKTPEQGLEYAAMGKAIPFVSKFAVKKFPILGKKVGELFTRKTVTPPSETPTIAPVEEIVQKGAEMPQTQGIEQIGNRPTIVSSNIRKTGKDYDSIIRIEIDDIGDKLSVKDFKQYLENNSFGARVEITPFKKGMIGAVKGTKSYRIDVYNSKGAMSGTDAKKLYDEKFNLPDQFKVESELQKSIPFEERFGTVIKTAVERAGGIKPTPPEKYGTAEEFVKGQKPLFRGDTTSQIRLNRAGEIDLSTDRTVADEFARKIRGGVVNEVYIKPGAKILDSNNLSPEIKKNILEYAELDGRKTISERDITDFAHDNKYDVVDFSGGSRKGFGYMQEVKVLNPDVLKTKSQLESIWNEANKGGVTEVPPIQPSTAIGEIPQPESNPFKELADALEMSKPIRETQEMMYSVERGKRFKQAEKAGKKFGGEAGLKAMMSKMKGQLQKMDFEPINISQQSRDSIAQLIIDAPNLTTGNKLTATNGLRKILGEKGGIVPTNNEIDILSQILPDEVIQKILKKQSFGEQLTGIVLDTFGIPRSIMASADLSFGGRQGIFAAPRFRNEFWNSWKKQFEMFGSEKAYQKHLESLVNDPDFLYAKESGISFTDIGRRVKLREERFPSKFAEKIPFVKSSARAYTAFANQYRLDIFKRMVNNVEKAGTKIRENASQSKRIAKLVNAMTGRGSLGKFEKNFDVLQLANSMFFSPRLIASRMTLLNPITYMQKDPLVRKEALKTLSGFLGFNATLLGIAKMLGVEVGLIPTSADFGKIKIGNTRIDTMGGFQQYAVLISRLLANKITSSTTGKEIKLGEGYRPLDRLSVLSRFLEYKEAPVPSIITSLLRGKTAFGDEMTGWNIPKEIGKRFIPMVTSDIYDLYNDDPTLIPLAILPIFGIGLQTYSQKKPKQSKTFQSMLFQKRREQSKIKQGTFQ